MVETAILQFFESIRNPFLTALFGVFSLFGESLLVGAILMLVFWLTPRRTGEQIVVTVLSSFCLNSLLKYRVARARPYVNGPVSKLEPPLSSALAENASFPSGHSQISAALFGSAATRVKKIAARIACGGGVLLVMISRLYFGVHYPTDVLAGLLFGAIAVAFWAAIYRFAYGARHLVLLTLAAAALLPVFFSPSHEYVESAGMFSGVAVALSAGHFLLQNTTTPFPRRLHRIAVGLALVVTAFAFALLFPKGEAYTLLKWFLLSLTGFLVIPAVFERLKI